MPDDKSYAGVKVKGLQPKGTNYAQSYVFDGASQNPDEFKTFLKGRGHKF
jgi:hypothetical protein